MTDAEYASTWAIARSLWPQAVGPSSDAVRRAWRRTLDRFAHREVCSALEALATSGPFPELYQVVAWIEAHRPSAPPAPRLTAAGPNDLRPGWERELRAYAGPVGWTAAQLQERLDEVWAIPAYRPGERPQQLHLDEDPA